MLSCDQERLKNNVTCTIQKAHDTSVLYVAYVLIIENIFMVYLIVIIILL